MGPLLCWAVVFADIGTSVYYVPGILYGQVGPLAATFVVATGLVFILLAEKYADIASRYREGGGVVTVGKHAFGPYMGALGGSLITVDYFLTSAISSTSGFHYLDSVVPLGGWIVPCTCLGLLLLGVLNAVGIRESATVTAWMAVGALLVNLIVLLVVAVQLSGAEWAAVKHQFTLAKHLGPRTALIGFAGAWLAFSGIESISQLSPAIREPRLKTARMAMLLVVLAILAVSPLMTAFVTGLDQVNKDNAERFVSELGGAYGGFALKLSVVVSASVLLLFAANTAIIGGYHVFRALSVDRFMPEPLGRIHPRLGTPLIAIGVAVFAPIAIVVALRGDINALGHLYAFGLLGAFTLSSVGLDVVRWRERERGVRFYLGLLTSLAVVTAWVTMLVTKRDATLFGGSVTALFMLIAVGVRRGWFEAIAIPVPYLNPRLAEQAAADEPEAAKILTIDEAIELRSVYHPQAILCLRGGRNEELLEAVCGKLKEQGDRQLYVLFVDEIPGLFYPAGTVPSPDANLVLQQAAGFLDKGGITAVPVWRVGHRAGEAIAETSELLEVKAVLIGTSKRTPLWKLLRGSVLRDLKASLPEGIELQVVQYGGPNVPIPLESTDRAS